MGKTNEKRVILVSTKILKNVTNEEDFVHKKIQLMLLKKKSELLSSAEYPELNIIIYVNVSNTLINSVKKGVLIKEGILLELTLRKTFKIIYGSKASFDAFKKWQKNEKDAHLGIGA